MCEITRRIAVTWHKYYKINSNKLEEAKAYQGIELDFLYYKGELFLGHSSPEKKAVTILQQKNVQNSLSTIIPGIVVDLKSANGIGFWVDKDEAIKILLNLYNRNIVPKKIPITITGCPSFDFKWKEIVEGTISKAVEYAKNNDTKIIYCVARDEIIPFQDIYSEYLNHVQFGVNIWKHRLQNIQKILPILLESASKKGGIFDEGLLDEVALLKNFADNYLDPFDGYGKATQILSDRVLTTKFAISEQSQVDLVRCIELEDFEWYKKAYIRMIWVVDENFEKYIGKERNINAITTDNPQKCKSILCSHDLCYRLSPRS